MGGKEEDAGKEKKSWRLGMWSFTNLTRSQEYSSSWITMGWNTVTLEYSSKMLFERELRKDEKPYIYIRLRAAKSSFLIQFIYQRPTKRVLSVPMKLMHFIRIISLLRLQPLKDSWDWISYILICIKILSRTVTRCGLSGWQFMQRGPSITITVMNENNTYASHSFESLWSRSEAAKSPYYQNSSLSIKSLSFLSKKFSFFESVKTMGRTNGLELLNLT